jgi:CDP-diacylglycerol--serine O-phosphatidyltransferase
MAFEGNYRLAFWCVVFGAVADMFDGKVARMVDGASEFGVQYDSLADVITFGFAPSAIIFNMFGRPEEPLIIAIAFFPLLFGSIRLARFNANLVGFDKDHFVGLPIPAAALSMLSIVPLNEYLLETKLISAELWKVYPELTIVAVIFYSLLMVSTVTYQTMPNFSLELAKENLLKTVLFAIFVPISLLKAKLVFALVMFLFAFFGVLKWTYKKLRHK